MAYVIAAMGAALAAGGAFFLLLGFDIVMTERGAAMTIGGTVALSGGVVTLALAALLGSVRALDRRLVATAHAQPPPGRTSAAAPAATAAIAGATAAAASTLAGRMEAPAGDAAADDSSPPYAAASGAPAPDMNLESVLEDLLTQPAGSAGGAAAAPAGSSEPASGGGERDFGASPYESVPSTSATAEHPATRSSPDGLAAHDAAFSAGEQSVRAEGDHVAPPTAPSGESGRHALSTYRVGGRAYTMFSDGSVEIETPDGVVRYDSVQEFGNQVSRPSN